MDLGKISKLYIYQNALQALSHVKNMIYKFTKKILGFQVQLLWGEAIGDFILHLR